MALMTRDARDARLAELRRFARKTVGDWAASCVTVVDVKTYERMCLDVEKALRPTVAHLLAQPQADDQG